MSMAQNIMNEHRVIVIGGGPAGLMAAGQAAASGAEVLLLEKMMDPGRKLRITGKGRCNLTNMISLEEFLLHFGSNGKFLRYSFSRFFNEDLLAFFNDLGVETVLERGARVFPISNDAQDVVDALTNWVLKLGVSIRTQSEVDRIMIEDEQVVGVVLTKGSSDSKRDPNDQASMLNYSAGKVIVATGGASYPGTGSTGDGYRMAKAVGHTIIPIRPALVPLVTSGDTARRLQGLSLRNVTVRILIEGKKSTEAFGEMLFTHFGLSGPIILTLSKVAVDALRDRKEVFASIDLKPALETTILDARLQRDFNAQGKKQYRTILKGLLPQKLIPICLEATGISPEKPAHQITSQERKDLLTWLKDFRFEIRGHRSFSQAIITAGGVHTREVDPRSMASRKVAGLYFAGEVLDIDADTGGYNLQAAFSTGWLAGRSAANR
jgi:predicted Rossmann fold flavoprotein